PDGDSLGSIAALGLALEQLGMETTCAMADKVPDKFAFLPGYNRFTSEIPEVWDLLVVLDCSEPQRLESLDWLLAKAPVIVNLDHHFSPQGGIGTYNYIKPETASTGEIVLDLLDCLPITLTQEIAECLYTSISSDSGSFRYENTTPETFRKGARLLECGIPAARIGEHLFNEKPLISLRLLQIVLNRIQLSPNGELVWSHLQQKDLQEFGALEEDAEGLIDYLRSIRGVEVALLFREVPSGEYRVNLRSRGKYSVREVAAHFGGGGHLRAAGCTLALPWLQVQEQVVKAMLNEMAKQI
ncbi:MAG: bifunctional oligoribonuclease/PAP phosphatase NrnA, partial [Clostridia bacterium]|nr:bifunctional oligoribonuclease/PAP phosphatase NrnA [Clostridia bacterium]